MSNRNATTDMIRVLFLAANPRNTDRLRLDEEARTIEERLRAAGLRERFQFIPRLAVRPADISEALLEHQPHIVHFSGHGTARGEIVLEDEGRRAFAVPSDAVSDLFRILKDNIQCVVLNACWSEVQAQGIAREIDHVIGMAQQISDEAALAFASGFYRALGYGLSVPRAFELGRNEIHLTGLADYGVPRLLSRAGAEPPVAAAPDFTPGSAVFISYAHVNRSFVDRLITDLQAQHVDLWIDRMGLKPGTPSWEQAIRDAIRSSRAVLLVASPESRHSPFVQDELAIAQMYDRPVYPLWAAGTHWIDCVPLGMGKTQYIDLREGQYESGLTEIVGVLRGEAVPAPPPPTPPGPVEPRNPYKGLDAFQERDQGDFFGREELIQALVRRIAKQPKESRLLAVIGPSGAGKSSVVLAGLLPRLSAGALPGSDRWVYLPSMKPGTSPLESLALVLYEWSSGSFTDLLKDLADPAARGLHLLARNASGQASRCVVLVIDQFEELFTQTVSETARQQFINLLTTAVTEPDGPLTAIVTLRADFYDRPMQYADLLHLLSDGAEPVPPMSLPDLRAVIEAPSQLPDVQMTFEEGLVAELVFQVREQSGALPLLQFTLDQLFERRKNHYLTWEAYRAVGGLRGALAKHAEATFVGLPTDAHRQMARWLFLRLIEPGTTEQETTRRRAAQRELALPDAVQAQMMRETMHIFVNGRLLTTAQMGDTLTVEVSHEALIREWGRLSGWLGEARDDIRQQKTIAADAVDWARRGRKSDDGGLYRGTLLIDAQAWARRNMPSADEMAFIEASAAGEREHIAQEERRIRELNEAIQRATKAQESAAQAGNRARTARRIAAEVAIVATATVVIAIIGIFAASSEVAQVGKTLTPVPQTLAAANAQVTAARVEVNVVGRTLTPIPITLTAVAAHVQEAKARIESLRLAAAADGVLQDPYADKLAAVLLGIQALKTTYTEQADAALVRSVEAVYPVQEYRGHTSSVWSVAFSPDGRYILTGSWDNTARLWEVTTGRLVRTFFGHTNYVSSVAFSPDGRYAFTGSFDKTARLWEVATGRSVRTFSGHSSYIFGVAFSPDGRYTLTGSQDYTARLWEVATGQSLRTFSGHTNTVFGVAFSPDGRYALTSSSDNTARVWEVATGQSLRTFSGHTNTVFGVAFSPDGRYALTGSWDSTARLWNVTTGQSLRTFSGHTSYILSAAFSPDGRYVLTGSDDRTARLWDVTTGQSLRTFSGHTSYVASVAFSLDGRYVLTGSDDTTVRLWEVATGQNSRAFSGHTSYVWSVTFSPDSRYVLTGSNDTTARLWEAATRQSLRAFSGHTSAVSSVAFSPDGRYALTGSDDTTARLWEVATGQSLRTFSGHTSAVSSVAFSPDGRYALTGSDDTTARLWEVATGQSLRTFSGHTSAVSSVAFSPDGRYALTGSDDTTARLWEVATGQSLRTLSGHTNAVSSVAFSPDGRYALTGSGDNTARLWEVATGQSLRTFSGHTNTVYSVAFSPDGRYALTGSGDNTARLWEVATGMNLRTLSGHTAAVLSVAFSPNYALTGSVDATARLWETDYRDFIVYACTRVYRDFTDDERRHFGLVDQYGNRDKTPTCPRFAQTAATPSPIHDTWTPCPIPIIPAFTALPSLVPTDTATSGPSPTTTPTLTPSFTLTERPTFTASPGPSPAQRWTSIPTRLIPIWTPIASPTTSDRPTPSSTAVP